MGTLSHALLPTAHGMAPRARPLPKAIALWRYEQIEDALGVRSRELRGPLLADRARLPVLWPSGATRPVSLASLYRWVRDYEDGGLVALRPAPRKDKGKTKARLPKKVVQKALELLGSDPEISLTFLLAQLRADPELGLGRRGIRIARSTLQRRLAADPSYARVQRSRKLARRRGRYVARCPHQIWHLDAKGPVEVRLVSGQTLVFHVITVIDDATRYVLATLVVPTPDLRAAVRVFRLAAKRWGLPDLVYADRASIFDSVPFRAGLAELGSHRIKVRPRNPEANGKIEAYHRVLRAWFTGRLHRQKVVDLVHLQQLLDAMIEIIYQDHRHRGLKTTPRLALKEQTSKRRVSAQRLDDAFREERKKSTHPKTGEVDFPGGTYLVPSHLRGQKLTFLVDPDPEIAPLVVEPGSGRPLALVRAMIRPEDHDSEPPSERWGDGPLQVLYDAWKKKVRPIAQPGFGLPEIFLLLADASGRPVPRSDAEAARIQRTYRAIGPLPKKATEVAFRRIRKELGTGRPIQTYLDALARRVTTTPSQSSQRPPINKRIKPR